MTAMILSVMLASARGQAPPPGLTSAPPSGGPNAKPGDKDSGAPPTADSPAYRFTERYVADADAAKAKPGDLMQYRVATRDVIRVMTDKPQGTPDRAETTVQVIYSERPAQVNSSGIVSDVVRRYEAFRVTPMPRDAPTNAPRPLLGLSVWYKSRPRMPPQLISLTPSHSITDAEYSITRQLLYFPDLSLALPSSPVRIGDEWKLPPAAATTLMGDLITSGDALVATLTDVKPSADGSKAVASIDVVGRALVGVMGIDKALNARLSFAFPKPAGGGKAGDGVDAVGSITSVRLTRGSQSALGDKQGRLKRTFTHEVIVERQVAPDEKSSPTIAVKTPPPITTNENSWLVYEDPRGRFFFRHPQELLLEYALSADADPEVKLSDLQPGSGEGRILQIRLQTKSGKPREDKLKLDPNAHLADLKQEWAEKRQTVKMGDIGWLPESEWTPSKKKAYRIEAALTSRDGVKVFHDHYLVLFSQNESLSVDAFTGQSSQVAFRKEVEEILKTVQLGAYKPEK